MAERFLAAAICTPDLFEQLFSCYDITGRGGKTQQNFHGLGGQVFRNSRTRNPPLGRLHEQVSEVKPL